MTEPKPRKPRVFKPPYWRYRELNSRSSTTTDWKWWTVSPTGVITYTVPLTKSTVGDRIGEFRSMGDVVTPSYQVTSADGGIVNSPMSQTIETTWGSDCGWYQKNTVSNPGSTYNGESTKDFVITAVGAPWHIMQPGVPDAWVTEAATKVISKLNASQVQITTNLLKLKSNVGLVAGAFQRLKSYIRKFSRGRSDPAGLVDAVATSWLEGRYGWRVFLREIDKYLQAIAQDLVEPTREVARASVSGSIGTWAETGYVGTGVGNIACTTTTTVAGAVRCGILHQDSVQNGADVFGFRLSDIPYSAWDLVPFSFVLNWAFNVDTLLKTLSAVGVTRLAQWTVLETTTTTVRTHSHLPPAGSGWTVVRPCTGSETRVTVERTRFPHVRNPGLVVKQSALAFLQDIRLVDTLALITKAGLSARKLR